MDDRKFNIGDRVIIKDNQTICDYDSEYALIIGYSSEGYQAYTFLGIEDIDHFLEGIQNAEIPRILYKDEIRKYEHISDCPTSMLYFMTGMEWINKFIVDGYRNPRLYDYYEDNLYEELKEKKNA